MVFLSIACVNRVEHYKVFKELEFGLTVTKWLSGIFITIYAQKSSFCFNNKLHDSNKTIDYAPQLLIQFYERHNQISW